LLLDDDTIMYSNIANGNNAARIGPGRQSRQGAIMSDLKDHLRAIGPLFLASVPYLLFLVLVIVLGFLVEGV